MCVCVCVCVRARARACFPIRNNSPFYVFPLHQSLWNRLELKKYFEQLCWSKYHKHLEISRMSVNQISKGLVWHHDFVLKNQPDDCLTSPGMTFVIHLGKDDEDVVYIEYKHDLSRRTVCTPGTAYVFPGGCFKHRTVREYNITSNHKVLDLTDRFSLVTFLNFNKAKAREMDIELHEQFPDYNDNFKFRSENYKRLSNQYGF